MDFVAAMRAEIAGLEASLRASPDPRAIKLHELQKMLALYEGRQAPEATAIQIAAIEPDRSPKPSNRRTSPERQQALAAAREILREQSLPMKTAEIFKLVEARGIKLGGNDPQNNLSALLHNSDEFLSHGRLGWTVKRKPTVDDEFDDLLVDGRSGNRSNQQENGPSPKTGPAENGGG
ncbi:hypothetical protein [Bosea sp. NPDC055594]